MDFSLDEGQLELQQTVARFCADRFPLDALAGREAQPLDRTTWSGMADLGILGLLEPDSGLGVVDATIAFEQLGSHLAPGPLLWTVLAAPLVPGAAAGDTVVTGAHVDDLVDGSVVVQHASDADLLLVLDHERVLTHPVGEIEALDSLDPLATAGRLTGLGAGEVIGDAVVAKTLRNRGTVLAAALLVGVADRALDVARAYALERQQFGAAIGSFQAVKHLLADMYVRVSSAQSATYAAAAVLDDPGRDDPARAAAAAKLLAGEAARTNASTAVQVLGGMGFTWDMLPNHLLKRAWSLEHELGTVEDHEATLGATFLAAAR